MYRRQFSTYERNMDLHEAYKRVIDNSSFIVLEDVLTKTVNSPAKRFYISSDRVYGVLVRWDIRGETTKLISEERQEMYEEIYRRVKLLRENKKDTVLAHLIEEVIEQPAPKFYIKPESAKIILCRHKQTLKKQRKVRQ